jgi:hypothetical protein
MRGTGSAVEASHCSLIQAFSALMIVASSTITSLSS